MAKDRGLALLHHVFRATHGVCRIHLYNMAGDQPVEQHPQRGQGLLYRGRRDLFLELLDERGDMERLHGGKVVKRYTIAVGAPGSPTPTGRFAVTDRLTTGDPSGPYGCCILALSARSPHAIQGWAGGNRIAIHSTPETSSIGQAASHGCMRLTLAEGKWLLDHVPLGTPTIIRA